MKRSLLFLWGIMLCFSAFAQEKEEPPTSAKARQGQNELINDVFVAYNYGSLYMTNPYVHHDYAGYPEITGLPDDAATFGAITVGYNRMLTRVIMLGFVASYQHCTYTGVYMSDTAYQTWPADISDQILSGILRVTFNYLNKPIIRLYSSAGIGVAVAFSTVTGTGPGAVKESVKQLMPGVQVTFIGIRMGRALGGFFELGVGTNAMISLGVNYQFKD